MRIIRDRAGNFTNNDQEREYPYDGLGATANRNGTGDVIVNTNEMDFAEAWVLCTGQGLACFRTGRWLQRLWPETGQIDFGQGWTNRDNMRTVSFSADHQSVPASVYIDG